VTDAEHVDMVEAGNKFWLEFSDLCQKHIDAAPAHLRDEYTMYLGDKTSIYGRKSK
jgi:hypothetical protein